MRRRENIELFMGPHTLQQFAQVSTCDLITPLIHLESTTSN